MKPAIPFRSSVLVAGLASALLGLAASAAQAQAGAELPGGPRHAAMHRMAPGDGAGHHRPPGAMRHERALDLVGATAEQKAKVREILRAAHADDAREHQAQRDLQQRMAQLLAAPQIDPAAAESLRQQMAAGHDARSKRMLQARLDAAAVLTPDQRQKLAEQMRQHHEMMQRHQRERRQLDTPRS
jgi:periplasmic protein CpxP/Spy